MEFQNEGRGRGRWELHKHGWDGQKCAPNNLQLLRGNEEVIEKSNYCATPPTVTWSMRSFSVPSLIHEDNVESITRGVVIQVEKCSDMPAHSPLVGLRHKIMSMYMFVLCSCLL
jgi:hypothetical protein